MSKIIIHHKGVYNIYSTIVDAALFDSGINLDQLNQYYEEEFGNSGLDRLVLQVKRSRVKGSGGISSNLSDVIKNNRAGEHEECISESDFIERFLTIKFDIGDKVKLNTVDGLYSGGQRYDYAIVSSLEPLVLISEQGDMTWYRHTIVELKEYHEN